MVDRSVDAMTEERRQLQLQLAIVQPQLETQRLVHPQQLAVVLMVHIRFLVR